MNVNGSGQVKLQPLIILFQMLTGHFITSVDQSPAWYFLLEQGRSIKGQG